MQPLPPPSQPPSAQPNQLRGLLGPINPATGQSMGYGVDPLTPATMAAAATPASVPNQYSISTPP
eukprot:5939286-Amphidinium_carterae.1